MVQKKFDLIIFDWDGTLFDSTAVISQSVRRAASELHLGELSDAQAKKIIGLSLPNAAKVLFGRELDADELQDFIGLYRRYYFSDELNVLLFDGVLPLLTQLQAQHRYLAIATGKSRQGLNHMFASRPDLKKLFIATRTSDQTASKPNPLMLNEILEEMDLPASATVMIGDTSFDIEMAHHAQMDSIAVSYGAHGQDDLQAAQPTAMAHTVAQLQQLLL